MEENRNQQLRLIVNDLMLLIEAHEAESMYNKEPSKFKFIRNYLKEIKCDYDLIINKIQALKNNKFIFTDIESMLINRFLFAQATSHQQHLKELLVFLEKLMCNLFDKDKIINMILKS